jgi:hypothetical protein
LLPETPLARKKQRALRLASFASEMLFNTQGLDPVTPDFLFVFNLLKTAAEVKPIFCRRRNSFPLDREFRFSYIDFTIRQEQAARNRADGMTRRTQKEWGESILKTRRER